MEITEVPPQAERFLGNDNPVIALEAIFILILLVAYAFERRTSVKQNEILRELSTAVSELTGAINAKK